MAMVGEVGGLKVAALSDGDVAHAGVREADGLAGDVDDLGAVLEAEGVVVFGADGVEEWDLSWTASTSPSRNWILRPERSPPACTLVWPGQT